jgi:RNA polymerase sigma-70 factor (ECF subfamily)
LVQESFLRAYRKLRTLREPEQFGPWIISIARFVGRERRRALHRDRHEYQGTEEISTLLSAESGTDLLERDQLEHVMQRLSELEERERLAVHMYYLDARDAEQAAELLGMSRSGFYALLRRAIARLATVTKSCASRGREGNR